MTAPQPRAELSNRWFRTYPDSSVRIRPRLLARSLIDASDLEICITFYERLLGQPADLRMPIPDFGGLELAAVGDLLLIASIRPFTPNQRQTSYSLIVPSLDEQLETLQRMGSTILEPPEAIVPGSRARVRYPDGTIAELVEHRPQPGETPAPPRAAHIEGAPETAPQLLARHQVPRDAFPATVTLYENLLDCPAQSRTHLRKPPVEAAIIGDLLLVGDDDPDPAHGAATSVALLTPAPQQLHTDAPADPRTIMWLPNRVLAEVWDSTVLTPDPGR